MYSVSSVVFFFRPAAVSVYSVSSVVFFSPHSSFVYFVSFVVFFRAASVSVYSVSSVVFFPPPCGKGMDARRGFAQNSRMRAIFPTSRRTGFTLIEMLAIVSILSVLLGIVLSAIHSAQNQSKRAIARAEVRSVESAFKMYLDHYGNWTGFAGFRPASDAATEDFWFVVDSGLAAALEGRIADDKTGCARLANPDALPFIEFSRHLRVDNDRIPVNPWNGNKKALREDSTSGPSSPELGDSRFFVAIDGDFDGVVDLQALGLTDSKFRMPKARTASPHGTSGEDVESISRPVVVWTYNPENTRDEAIVSWME